MHRTLSIAALAASAFVSTLAIAADTTDGRPAGSQPQQAAALVQAAPTPQAARSDAGTSPQPSDQVIPDDLIVQGSQCVGFDCVDNETFGFDTLRLKENNTRIVFFDTSADPYPN
ncbi:MAG: hypothetical protein ACTHK2_00775, partial [Dokdonella sp.]|uniref:hypothetical protein n=1 Tax=Dokdonella sp. TaxID=2291710 RepID=UPI003F7F65F7